MTDTLKDWSVNYRDDVGLFAVNDSSGDPVKGDYGYFENIARLLTAAPELLETVKDCSVILDSFGFKDTFEAKRCRNVLASLEPSS